MRPGSTRDPSDTNNLHQAQKRLTRRVAALEESGLGLPPSADEDRLQALQTALNRIEEASKARDDQLRGQILAVRGQLAKANEKIEKIRDYLRETQDKD